MTKKKKLCSNCGLIPAEKYMKKLADQNFYCNDCREVLIGCSAKELESSLNLVNQLANLQIQELQQINQLLHEQLVELQQENFALKVDLKNLAEEKIEIQTDSQKVIQNHQQEILQLQQKIQQSELPKSTSRLVFWRRG